MSSEPVEIPERYKELHRIGQMYGSVYLPSTILFELGAAESQIRELAHDRTVAVDTNAVLVESIESLQAQLRQELEAQEKNQREWFTKGLHEGQDQMSSERDGWRVLAKAAEEKVSQLQITVAQLKEDRDTWMGQGKRANLQVAELQTTVEQLREEVEDGEKSAAAWQGTAETHWKNLLLAQTTVGQQAKQLEDCKTGRGLAKMDISTLRTALQKYGSHRPECDSWSRPNKASGKHCSCGFAALATCPAPAKENE